MTNIKENSWIIWDDEIKDLDSWWDLLWTKSYVEILDKIINDITIKELWKWYNIWLYWWWGSGKSSILRSLVERNKDNPKLHFIWYDCWKYSKDDFRRTFLFEIVNNYTKIIETENLQKDLLRNAYKDISLSESKDDFDFKLTTWSLLWTAICFIAIFLLLYGISKKWPELRESNAFRIIVFSFSILIWIFELSKEIIYKSIKSLENLDKRSLYKNIQKIFNKGETVADLSLNNIQKIIDLLPRITRTTSITEWKLFSWEQFEDWFKCLIFDTNWWKLINLSESSKKELGKIHDNHKWQKHIFILDNIDRCWKESIHELFMTIKSFFNQKNCIFIIPIDYDSVCSIYNKDFWGTDNKYEEWNEFLRKIFNVWIHIDLPLYDKLYEFTKEIIKNNWLKDNNSIFEITEEEVEEIACTLSWIFSKNPRKIKQFLNKLSAENERLKWEINKHKPDWWNKSRLISTMKRLIIQQEIPKLYKYLLENPFYENKIIEYIEWINNKENLEIEQKNEKDPIFKNIPKLNEQSFNLIKRLSWLNVNLLLYPDSSILIQYLDKPEEFFQVIDKNKELQKEAKDLILNKSTTFTWSRYLWVSLINLCIWFIGNYGFNREMFMSVFKKDLINLWLYDNISVTNKILYSFLHAVNQSYLKKLGPRFSIRFTNKLLINFSEESTYFTELDDPKKQFLIIWSCIISLIESSEDLLKIRSPNIEETNIYRFTNLYNKYLDNTTIDKLVNMLPKNINDFNEHKNFNLLKLIQLIWKIPTDSVKAIEDAMIWFEPNRLINYNSWTPLSFRIKIDSYFILSEIAILSKSKNINNILKNFTIIFNHKKDPELVKQITNILEKDVKTSEPYNRPYLDFVIDKELHSIISLMLIKTNESENHNWLKENQLTKIIDNIDKLWYWLLENIRNYDLSKNILFDNLKTKRFDKIYKIANYINITLKIRISIKDKRLLKTLITNSINTELKNKPYQSVILLNNYIENNPNFINYINKKYLLNTLLEIRDIQQPRTIYEIKQYNEAINKIQSKILKK